MKTANAHTFTEWAWPWQIQETFAQCGAYATYNEIEGSDPWPWTEGLFAQIRNELGL